MKRSLLSAALCSVIILTGCGNSNKTNQISHPQTAEQIANTNSMPNKSEIANAYYKSLEAFSWFYIDSLAYQETESDDNVESQESDGKIYYKIDVSNLETYDDLQKYLRALFSDNIVEGLLNSTDKSASYKDINGKLFGTIYSRAVNSSKSKQNYTIIKVDETKFIYKVTVRLLGDDMKETGETESHEFNYEYINGKWVFTNFYLFV